MNYKNKIYNLTNQKKSLFLVGRTNSGKTYFVLKELVPFLKSKGVEVTYFSNCNKITILPKKGIAIMDEVETFKDREFLEKRNKEKHYYSDLYIKKVKDWFKKLKKVKIPTIYITTRNGKKEIRYFVDNVKTTDWDERKVNVIIFSRRN